MFESLKWRGSGLLTLALFAATFCLFFKTGTFEFLNFDDPLSVAGNIHVLRGVTSESLEWASITAHLGYPQFLTWFSFMLDIELFGPNPGALHLVSALIHSINACLLFHLLHLVTGSTWRSLFAAALFAFHPQRCESVAWLAERKDILWATFALATMITYVLHLRTGRAYWRWISIILFTLALLAKTMAVITPPLLVLIDLWPRFQKRELRSLKKFLLFSVRSTFDKMPYLILAGVFSCFALRLLAASEVTGVDFGSRVALMCNSYAGYIGKFFWPADLALLYPIYPVYFDARIAGLLLLGGLITICFLWFALRGQPACFIGWCWFLIVLFPVSGILQNGSQSMADRYSYFSTIGLTILILWGALNGVEYWSKNVRVIIATAGCMVTAATWLVMWKELDYWRDSVAIWKKTLEATRGRPNVIAQINLGAALLSRGELDAAIQQFRTAAELRPDIPNSGIFLVDSLLVQNQPAEARKALNAVLEKLPLDASLVCLRAAIHRLEGNQEAALKDTFEAVQFAPDNPRANGELSHYFEEKNDLLRALKYARIAAITDPLNGAAQQHLWQLLRKMDRPFAQVLEEYLQIVPAFGKEVSPLISAARIELGQSHVGEAEVLYRNAHAKGYCAPHDTVDWASSLVLLDNYQATAQALSRLQKRTPVESTAVLRLCRAIYERWGITGHHAALIRSALDHLSEEEISNSAIALFLRVASSEALGDFPPDGKEQLEKARKLAEAEGNAALVERIEYILNRLVRTPFPP